MQGQHLCTDNNFVIVIANTENEFKSECLNLSTNFSHLHNDKSGKPPFGLSNILYIYPKVHDCTLQIRIYRFVDRAYISFGGMEFALLPTYRKLTFHIE